jgi:hypothetical protein
MCSEVDASRALPPRSVRDNLFAMRPSDVQTGCARLLTIRFRLIESAIESAKALMYDRKTKRHCVRFCLVMLTLAAALGTQTSAEEYPRLPTDFGKCPRDTEGFLR